MPQEVEDLRGQIETLTCEVRSIQQRLDELEGRADADVTEIVAPPPAPFVETTGSEVAPASAETSADSADPMEGAVSFLGRTLIVLGGAFLLRAITDSSVIPPLGGAIAGLVYAIWWLVQADRAAQAERRLSASFHGLATAIIAYPLIWETTARFELLNTTTAAIVLVILHYLGLAVAWHRKLETVAWTFTLFSAATAMGLLFTTHDLIPFTLALLIIAIGIESLAFQDQWLELRWPIALAFDLSIVFMVTMASRVDGLPAGYAPLPAMTAVVISSLLPTLYFGSIVARTLLSDHVVRPFEFVQASLAFLVGVGGAIRVTAFIGASLLPAAVSILLLGIASYATSFTSIDRRSGRGINFYSYTTLAIIMIIAGSSMLSSGAELGLSLALLAVATTVVGRHFDRITLKFHGAIYMVAAAIACGLVTFASNGLLADPTSAWHSISPACAGIAILAVFCYVALASIPTEKTSPWYMLLPQATLAALVVWSAGGIAVGALPGLLGLRQASADTDPAVVVAARPSVLAVLSMLMAWSARRWSLKELTWLVYPVLILGGVKLVFESLQHGRPETLFVAFALYGGALIVTPRLAKIEF